MSPRALILALSACLLLAGAAHAATTKIVEVDCSKGDSINSALETKAPVLIIEILGVCEEEVIIRRPDVTLRGAEPGAAIVGPDSPAFFYIGGINVDGASGVTLTDLVVRDGRRGVTIREGGAASLERVTLQDNTVDGLTVSDSSFARITDVTAQRNGRFGIAVWESALTLEATTIATDNGRGGLLLSASHAQGASSLTDEIRLNDNGTFGLAMQIGSTAQMNVAASGNFVGIWMFDGGNYAGGVEATGNGWGVVLEDGPLFEVEGTVADNVCIGIYGGNATLVFSGDINGNGCSGLWLEGTAATIGAAAVADPASLGFGTRVDFAGGNSFTGGISCDETVLTRGDVSCPPPAPLEGVGSPAAKDGKQFKLPSAPPTVRTFRMDE